MDQKVEIRNTPENSRDNRVGKAERPGSEFLFDWKCWFIAALSLLTLVLLFQPWLVASGPHGDVRADAFGRLDGSVPLLRNAGERLTEGVASISALWGVLSATATALVLLGVAVSAKSRAGVWLTNGAAAANAVFVSGGLLYLDGKAPELRAMTESRDELKAVLTDFVGGLFGRTSPEAGTAPEVATAALTGQALFCALLVMATVVIALGMRNPVRPAAVESEIAGEEAHRYVSGEPVHEQLEAAGDIVERQLEQYEFRLADRLTDERDSRPDDAGRQRLLPRGERLRRTSNQAAQVRRDRAGARRPRPRPTHRVSATGQPASGAAAQRGSRSGQAATSAQPQHSTR